MMRILSAVAVVAVVLGSGVVPGSAGERIPTLVADDAGATAEAP